MTIQKGINFNYRFEGELVPVNRSHFASVEDWKAIADHMLVDGRYASDLAREFDIERGQTIVNSFRKGSSGIKWLLKRIIEDGVVPIDSFWRHEVGRDVEAELNYRGWDRPQQGDVIPIDTCKDLIHRNQAVIDQVAAAQQADRPEPVDPEPTQEPVDGKHPDRDEAASQLNARIFALSVKESKIEAYDRTQAFVEELLASRMASNPNGVMADTLKLVLEQMSLK